MPIWWTHRIALVRGVSAAAMPSGSRLKVAGSMSTNTGTAPHWRITLAEATKQWLTVTTSSPGPTPAASSARCRAVVQFETAQAWGAPTKRRELGLERGDLRPLRQPAALHHGGDAAAPPPSPSQGRAIGIMPPAPPGRRRRHGWRATSATSSRSPCSSGTELTKPSSCSAAVGAGQPSWHRIDRPLWPVFGHEIGSAHRRGEESRPVRRRLVSVPLPTLSATSDASPRSGAAGSPRPRRGRGRNPWSGCRRRR